MTTARPARRPVGPRLSVIVPTKDSARTIRACLASVRTQRGAAVELVVVDNASADGTAAIARRHADVTIDTGPERSRQRNVGAATATGEYLLFVDSDMVLTPSVAADVVAAFDGDASLDALVIPERSVGSGFWAGCRRLEKLLYLDDPSVEAARAFRRTAFEAVGGYDESLHAGEDWDLAERVAGAGRGTVGRIRSGVLHDEGRLRLRAHLSKKVYYGRSIGRFARKHPAGAARRLFRPAFVRGLPTIARHPREGVGMLVLKALELAALTAGLVAARLDRQAAGR